jgi:hypothetical protein
MNILKQLIRSNGSNASEIQGLFENFMDSLYCAESELCGGVVTVSFPKHVAWQAMHFLQRSTHFSKTCCRQFAASFRRSLGAPFSWLEKPRNRMGPDLDCMADVLMGFHRSIFSKPNTEFNSDLAPCDFWAFPTMKMELRGKKFEVINGLQDVFEKWEERCKKCIVCQGRYFEKDTVTTPPQSSNSG